MTFSVAKPGKAREVVRFTSNGAFKVPCSAPGQFASVLGLPSAKINSAGQFAVGSSNTGAVGTDTTAISGAFTSKNAAAGAVAITFHPAPAVTCRLTVHWTAAFEAPSPPVAGAHYTGATGKNSAGGGRPVSFHVGANGKQLTSGTFGSALTCTGVDNLHAITAHNVPIHKGKFTFTFVHGKVTNGKGATETYVITGHFLSGRRAAGTTVYTDDQDFGSQSTQCSSSNTWAAHA